ncbi:hypothetical protein [Cytobacillus purgationiresistens]|uniref:DUF5071 domain-containing protein n=1 Tax=Cytobacillus purgationiresistens TaxID=863449 RepID=A0ABU0AQN1_9BACI|nr:hypothetical protein [Cytobacillus purgationiresistens]MDQ0272330.1 hypothetical protein [Cytobacillus purgationiresistens]
MNEYVILEDEEIIHYVDNLNWNLPKDIQRESMEVLSQVHPDKVDLLIPKFGKETWGNAIYILRKMGYPRNRGALPLLAGQIMDRNWPGSLEALEIFREIGKRMSTPFIENECSKAIKQKDNDWLEHLQYACESLGITEEDFNDAQQYKMMITLAEQ